MTLWTYMLREMQRRPGRTLLTLCGIVIGVAVLVADAAAIQAARHAYRDLYQSVAGADCLEVVAPGLGGFDDSFAPSLARSPLVRAVVPRIVVAAALTDSAGQSPALVCGTPAAVEPEPAEFTLVDGQLLSGDDGVLLDATFATAHGHRPGQLVRLWTPSGLAELPLRGTIRPTGPTGFSGAAVVRVSLATARRLFQLKGQVNSVQVLLAEGANRNDAAETLAPLLPPGLVIQSPGQRSELAQTTLMAAELGLHALGLVAVVAGAFVVLNTCLLNLAERRRQLAILRTLGATRSQVRRLLLAEASALGAAGAVLGLAAGLGLACVLVKALEQFLGVPIPAPRPSLRDVLLAALIGPGAALAATWRSACLAGRTAPLAELRGSCGELKKACGRWRLVLACLPLFAGAVLATAVCRSWVPVALGRSLLAPAIVLLLVGAVLLMPSLIGPLLAGPGRFLSERLGIEGRLARLQLLRRPARSGLTAGVLFLAITVAIGFGQSILSTLDEVKEWYARSVVADFIVRGAMPDSGFLLASPLPDRMGEELAALDGVEVVDRMAFVPAQLSGRAVLVLARTFAGDGPLPIDLQDGDSGAVARQLRDGEIVVGTALAQSLGLRIGSSACLATPQGLKTIRVAGTATEYAGGGAALYMDWDTARRLLRIPGPHVFLVTARKGEAGTAFGPLRELCAANRLLLQSNGDLRRFIEDGLTRVVAALWAVLGVLFAVASLAIVNTLAMTVLEQTRDLGVLRAIGLTRRRVLKLVLCHGLLLGLAGLVPGTAAGLGLAWLLHVATAALLGQRGHFHILPLLVAGSFALALLTAMLAGVLPARRAACLPIVQSLAR